MENNIPEIIIITFFHFQKFDQIKYKHNQEFPYSVRKRNKIINDVLNAGLSLKLRSVKLDSGKYGFHISIDDGNFSYL